MNPEKETRPQPRLFSIPPAAPFLPTLVNALLDGNIIPGFKPANDPLLLASITIYVPTRRAARALQAEFVARMQQNALLLPRILPLGDIEEEQFIFQPQADIGLDLDPVIGNLERQLLLTRLIRQWASALEKSSTKLFDGEAIMVPSSTTDAAWLANDLATLMDSITTEEANWSSLSQLVPEDHAEWWKLTLAFLKIATKSWPDILRERGAMDMAARRGALLRRQAGHYQNHGSTGPVIAAGSTGSIPATANLLRTIAHMENGAVILPGLDRDISDDVWAGLDISQPEKQPQYARTSHIQAAAPGHPQYGLKKLLDSMRVVREDVRHIGGVNDSSIGFARIRETVLSLSMEPSQTTDNWPAFRDQLTDETSQQAFSGVALVEASGEQQEARAIALAMREILNEEGKTAALVTPDRVLARRVSVELKRFGIEVDDSAGLPMNDTPQGAFVRLALAVALGPANPVNLLALIKHPLTAAGMNRDRLRRATRVMELGVIRGNIRSYLPGAYHAALETARKNLKDKSHVSPALKHLSAADWGNAAELAQSLDKALLPLHSLVEQHGPLGQLSEATIITLEALAVDEDGGLDALYGDEAGEALSQFLADLLVRSRDENLAIEAKGEEWPALFEALLGSRPVRQRRDLHPRLSIWGPLEARLQQVDRMVLGSLNEGSWPATAQNDPFLNRPMKNALALEPPERRIGLAAHDFQMALGIKDVVITRSLKAENAPTVASRWLQRLVTLAGDKATSAMKSRGQKYLDWVGSIDRRAQSIQPKPQNNLRPEPKPAPEIRPTKLSITEIETWIRDPYSIYARHVLNLAALDPIAREADARERGVLYHAIMEKFSESWTRIYDEANDAALECLLQISRKLFSESEIPVEVEAFWWPRFEEIARGFIAWEAGRASKVSTIMVERKAQASVGDSGFVIRGRADRIDQLLDGGHAIIDYKTGLSPSSTQASILLAPQLPLEGALALRGAFDGVTATKIEELLYVRLRRSEKFQVDAVGGSKGFPDAQTLSMNSWAALEALVLAYQNPEKGYLSRARPFRQGDISGDYDHLARVLEWSLDDNEGEVSP